MDRQTLRDWVHRYNAMGVAGLFDRPHGGGASPKLTGMQEATLAEWVGAVAEVVEKGVA
jgi:transposase